jgi:hypothetical protein
VFKVCIEVVCCILFQKSGIEKLVPNMMIDDSLFEPCGYSMNGISNKNVSVFLVCIKLFWKCPFCSDNVLHEEYCLVRCDALKGGVWACCSPVCSQRNCMVTK